MFVITTTVDSRRASTRVILRASLSYQSTPAGTPGGSVCTHQTRRTLQVRINCRRHRQGLHAIYLEPALAPCSPCIHTVSSLSRPAHSHGYHPAASASYTLSHATALLLLLLLLLLQLLLLLLRLQVPTYLLLTATTTMLLLLRLTSSAMLLLLYLTYIQSSSHLLPTATTAYHPTISASSVLSRATPTFYVPM